MLHARVKLNLYLIFSILLESHLFDFAVERWLNLKAEGSLERTSVSDSQLFGNRLNLNIFLPQVLEFKLRLVELKGWRDKVAKDVRVEDRLGLPITANDHLTLPRLRDLSDLERVSSEFYHDSHPGVEGDFTWHNGEDELFFLFGFFLAWQGNTWLPSVLGILRFFYFFSCLRLLLQLLLSSPDDLHWLSASIFEEELSWDIFVGVFCTKVDVFEIFLAPEGRSGTFSSESYLKVHSIVDDDMQGICESLNFISSADYFDKFIFFRLEYAMPLYNLPNTFFVLGKSRIFCINLGLVLDSDLLDVVSQNFNCAIIELILIYRDYGSDRVSYDDNHRVDVVSIKFNDEVGSHCTKYFGLELQIYCLSLPRLYDT